MTVKKWALLCGGDFYLPPKPTVDGNGVQLPRPKNLEGCVMDVEVMRQVLLNSGVPSGSIRLLTASSGPGPDRPVESEDRWPTWKNIKRELDHIIKEADRGDLFYFHYSGHGSLRQDIWEEEDKDGGIKNGTVLVMTDVFQDGPYLTGRHLGIWLRGMVEEKALRVTVVLDSCHSGGAFRGSDDEGVRYCDVPPMRQIDIDADKECDDQDIESTRDPSGILPCWLSNPTSCTVLTACSVHEVARERQFGKHKHGVLTYWLVQLLESYLAQVPPSHAGTVEWIRREIARGPPGSIQTPLAYGDVHFEFFGNAPYITGETCNATYKGDRMIQLDIGRNQGVAVGAQYNIIPADGILETEHPLHPPSLRVKVTKVFGFRSSAKPAHNDDVLALQNWPNTEIRHAILHRWALPEPVFIHGPSLELDRLDHLRVELEKTPGLHLGGEQRDDVDLSVRVSLRNKGTYEILQNNEPLRRLPEISVSDESWAPKLARVLSHVARYQALKRKLTNMDPSQKLCSSQFQLEATPSQVRDGQNVSLLLEYEGSMLKSSLWVSLYCFSSSWAIYKVYPGRGLPADRTFLDSSNGLQVMISFPAKVRASDPDEIVDQFVFFVATSASGNTPVSWGDICLPHLGPDASYARREWHLQEEVQEENGYRWNGGLHRVSGLSLETVEWAVIHTEVRVTP